MYVAVHCASDDLRGVLELNVTGKGDGKGTDAQPEAIVRAHLRHPDLFMSMTPGEARALGTDLLRAADEAEADYASRTARLQEVH